MIDDERSPSPRLAIWGHFHGGNLGDELVVTTIVEAIRKRLGDVPLRAISMAPDDTESRHRIPTTPINPRHGSGGRKLPGPRQAQRLGRIGSRLLAEIRFVVRSFGILGGLDRIVVSGSGQLLDAWRGPWWHPYTTFRWAALARVTRTRMVYPSVGAGPIDNRLSAFFIRKALGWAEYVSVRDDHSVHVLRSIGVERDLPVVPDMGWGWQDIPALEPGHGAGPTVVGLNAMSHEDPRYWPRGDIGRYRTYIEKISALTAHLVEEGLHVLMFSSQTRADRAVASDLRELLGRGSLGDDPRIQWQVDEIETEDDLAEAVARCDYVIAGRFHSSCSRLRSGFPRSASPTIRRPRICLPRSGSRSAVSISIDSRFPAFSMRSGGCGGKTAPPNVPSSEHERIDYASRSKGNSTTCSASHAYRPLATDARSASAIR